MRNVLTIFKKEFYRVITDRRLIFTTMLLPGLAIYLIYSFMGNAIGNELTDIEQHTMIVYTKNMPSEFENFVLNSDVDTEFRSLDDTTEAAVKDEILEGETDLYIIFDEDFMTLLNDYDNDATALPSIEIFYNPGQKYSQAGYSSFTNLMGGYRSSIGIERYGEDYHAFTTSSTTIIDEERASGQGFAQMMPMLIIIFLFSGAMSIGPDSIAGEKERGTIATLLITPIKRSELALGKVCSLSVISLFSASSSFIGILLSLPQLMQEEDLDFWIYGFSDFFMLFIILLATVLVIVGLISVVSAYAKSIKEASMLIMPLYFISIIVGVSTMFSGEASSNLIIYILPIYSSVNMIISILTFEPNAIAFFITVSSSLIYVGILVYILNKMFQSEQLMFPS